jgi:RHS repeat-associated protein
MRDLVSLRGTKGGNDILDFAFRKRTVDVLGQVTADSLGCGGSIPVGNPCGTSSPIQTINDFNRLGMLVSQQVGSVTETMGYDASGNLAFKRDKFGKMHLFSTTVSSNQLASDTALQMSYSYTNNGARDWEGSGIDPYETRFYYYDGLGRMTGSWGFIIFQGTPNAFNNAQACAYNADGIMLKPCDNGAPPLAYDGHNVIATRALNANGPMWRFIHGDGLDDPILGYHRTSGSGAKKLFYFVTDGQGRQFAFSDSSGTLGPDDLNLKYNQDGGSYAGGTTGSASYNADRSSSPMVPNLSLFRNRAYDQATGRWTQEDPVGVAGGINLYEFNGNNPVMFTDPFGLCPECKRERESVEKTDGDTDPGMADLVMAAATVVTAGGAMGGQAAVVELGESGPGKVIVGETMSRVREAALKYGAETFETTASGAKEIWRQNSTWLRGAMREGKEIIDIGKNPLRNARSPFYRAEQEIIERRGYPTTKVSE